MDFLNVPLDLTVALEWKLCSECGARGVVVFILFLYQMKVIQFKLAQINEGDWLAHVRQRLLV